MVLVRRLRIYDGSPSVKSIVGPRVIDFRVVLNIVQRLCVHRSCLVCRFTQTLYLDAARAFMTGAFPYLAGACIIVQSRDSLLSVLE